MWVCAKCQVLVCGLGIKPGFRDASSWMCGFRLWLSRQNLRDSLSFFRAAAIYNIFLKASCDLAGEQKPSALFLPDKSCARVEEKSYLLVQLLFFQRLFDGVLQGCGAAPPSWKCTSWMWLGSCLTPSKFPSRLCCVHWFFTIQPRNGYRFIRVNSQVPYFILFFFNKSNHYCGSLMATWSCLQFQFPAVQPFQVLVLKYPKYWFLNLTYHSDNRPILLVGLKEESLPTTVLLQNTPTR